MTKRCLLLLLCLALLPGLCRAELNLLIATDLHYITPELTDMGELFMRSVTSGDAKLSENGDAIVNALCDEAIQRRVDAVILTGDLTYNGERRSLEVLAERLARVENAGIPVFVLPGNHDINFPYAAYYDGGKAYAVAQISSADFRRICTRFGYQEAISRDSATCSYVASLGQGWWLLCLDANSETAPGRIPASTLQWAEEQLAAAQARGMRVISATHQNVQPHNVRFQGGYLIDNHEEVSALLRRYGVAVNLSGHMHAQQISTVDGLTDYATGSLCVAPLRFATLTLGEGEPVYTMHRLPILQQEAAERFGGRTRAQLTATVEELNVPQEYRQTMVDFGVEINALYFSGELTGDLTQTEGWRLWTAYAPFSSWYAYMSSMVSPAE